MYCAGFMEDPRYTSLGLGGSITRALIMGAFAANRFAQLELSWHVANDNRMIEALRVLGEKGAVQIMNLGGIVAYERGPVDVGRLMEVCFFLTSRDCNSLRMQAA